MPLLEKIPHPIRLALPYLLVFGVWGSGQYELIKARGLQSSIEAQAKTAFSLNEKAASGEMSELARCNWMVTPVTPAVRDCVVKLVPELKDWRVARFGALVLGAWLSAHPDDQTTRQAGIKLMDQTWASWFKDYQPAYEKLDDTIRDAREASWVYRFKYPADTAEFERIMYQMTAKMDLAIVSPEAARRVSERVVAHPASTLFE